jgi:hypothetical protein
MTIELRTCRTCGEDKAPTEFPHVQGGGEKRKSTECLDCLNAKDKDKQFRPIPACPVCKRPESAPHDTWCEHGAGEVYTIPPMDIAAMAMDRKLAEAQAEAKRLGAAIRKAKPTQQTPVIAEKTPAIAPKLQQPSAVSARKETPMPSATIGEALNGFGIMTSRDNLPDPEADRRAALAPKPAVARETMCPCGQAEKEQRKGRNGTITTTGRCVECRRFYQSKRRAAMREAAAQAQAMAQQPEPDLILVNMPDDGVSPPTPAPGVHLVENLVANMSAAQIDALVEAAQLLALVLIDALKSKAVA